MLIHQIIHCLDWCFSIHSMHQNLVKTSRLKFNYKVDQVPNMHEVLCSVPSTRNRCTPYSYPSLWQEIQIH